MQPPGEIPGGVRRTDPDEADLLRLHGIEQGVVDLPTELTGRSMVAERQTELSRFVPLDQLRLSPQCGFCSTGEGDALSEVAQELWG